MVNPIVITVGIKLRSLGRAQPYGIEKTRRGETTTPVRFQGYEIGRKVLSHPSGEGMGRPGPTRRNGRHRRETNNP
jgi:hypothetical protein